MKPVRRLLVVLIALTGTACTTPATPTTITTTTAAPTTTTAVPSTATAPAEVPPCLAGDQVFATDGALASGLLDGAEGDAQMVSGLRWTAYEGCERLVVELATAGGAPATEPGGVRAELLRSRGIIRLRLDPRVEMTSIAERVIEGALIDAAYVVRSLAGDLFVDLHLTSGVLARASVRRSPAELIVDVRADGQELDTLPVVGESVVVVDPAGGTAGYPLAVTGYARTFEANVVLRVRQDDRLVFEEVTTAADYLTTWGEFRIEVDDGPAGELEVFVGEDAATNGRERGVYFNLVMG